VHCNVFQRKEKDIADLLGRMVENESKVNAVGTVVYALAVSAIKK